MRILILLIAAAVTLCACAGPQLRENTVDMGPAFGSVQERQIIKNLGRYLVSPWSVPGQIDVTSGTLQVQNQAAFAFKLPYSAIAAQEADPSAQTQEQDSFVVTPVTDGDDLRRVQALYDYAICHDSRAFSAHWEETIKPYEIANARAAAAASKPTPSEQATIDSLKSINNSLKKIDGDLEALRDERKNAQTSSDKAAADTKIQTTLQLQNSLVANLTSATQVAATTASAGPSSSASAPSPTPNSGPSDSVELERAKKALIIRVLRKNRFIYWTDAGSPITASSPCSNISPMEASPPPGSSYLKLGTASGFDFWTNDPDKVAQFMMFVLGSTPNTSGVHALSSKQTGSSPPKSQGNQVLLFKQF